MKKTLTINLSGIVFNIDEDAFIVLKSYLDTIRGYFKTSEGRDEIMTDIESRIAKILRMQGRGEEADEIERRLKSVQEALEDEPELDLLT